MLMTYVDIPLLYEYDGQTYCTSMTQWEQLLQGASNMMHWHLHL